MNIKLSGHWTLLGGANNTFGIYPAHPGERGGWPGSRIYFSSGSVDDTLYLFGGGGYENISTGNY